MWTDGRTERDEANSRFFAILRNRLKRVVFVRNLPVRVLRVRD